MATVAEVAEWLGLSERRVKELRASGVLPGAPGEPYDLKACVRAYCAHMRPAAGKNAQGGSDQAQSLDEARIRLLTAQAEAREMLNEQLRGEAVTAEDMEAVVGAVVDGIRAKVLAVPTRAAPMVVGLSSLSEVQAKLTELIHEVCGELAATVIVSTVKDRAARRAGRGIDGDADLPADGAPAAPHGKRVG